MTIPLHTILRVLHLHNFVLVPNTMGCVLPAYNNSLHLTAADMSVMYKRNNRGPSIEPCGTPQVIPLATDIVPSTSVTCTLPVKYDQNQHI